MNSPRTIVTNLLELAGLNTSLTEDILQVSLSATRRYRRGSEIIRLDADTCTRLGITGCQNPEASPWIMVLVERLHSAADRGNRRALLTLRMLTDGWQRVASSLTENDREWVATAKRLGIAGSPA